jgi:hypothetical protein
MPMASSALGVRSNRRCVSGEKSLESVAKARGSDGKFFLALKITEPDRAAPRSRLLSIAEYKSNRSETETALGLPIVSSKASTSFKIGFRPP